MVKNKHLFNYEANAFIRDATDYVRLVVSERDGLSQYENVSSVKLPVLKESFHITTMTSYGVCLTVAIKMQGI